MFQTLIMKNREGSGDISVITTNQGGHLQGKNIYVLQKCWENATRMQEMDLNTLEEKL